MNSAVIAAVISAAATIIVNVIAIVATNSKTREEIKRQLAVQELQQATIKEKVGELSTDVKAHNEYGRQIPVITEQIKVINHRLDDLERARP